MHYRRTAAIPRCSLPVRSFAQGVTADGVLVVQAGGNIFAVDEAGSELIGSGVFRATIGDLVILYECETLSDCRSVLVDTATREKRDIELPEGFLETPTTDEIIVWTGPNYRQVYHLIDNDLVEDVDAGGPAAPLLAPPFALATSSNGVVARVLVDKIEIVDAGAVATTIPFDVNGCCTDSIELTFIDLS